jgi:DNA-binding response OmpR family regulator
MCSILVIDDEKNILNLLQEALTLSGHKVEVANDGHKGIQKFDHGSFDIVITDVLMPKLDGRSVVQYIRNSCKKSICIIGMSGTPWLLKDIDFDMILPKPFPLEELLGMVAKMNC